MAPQRTAQNSLHYSSKLQTMTAKGRAKPMLLQRPSSPGNLKFPPLGKHLLSPRVLVVQMTTTQTMAHLSSGTVSPCPSSSYPSRGVISPSMLVKRLENLSGLSSPPTISLANSAPPSTVHSPAPLFLPSPHSLPLPQWSFPTPTSSMPTPSLLKRFSPSSRSLLKAEIRSIANTPRPLTSSPSDRILRTTTLLGHYQRTKGGRIKDPLYSTSTSPRTVKKPLRFRISPEARRMWDEMALQTMPRPGRMLTRRLAGTIMGSIDPLQALS